MNGLRALRLAAVDLWDESIVLIGIGLFGGLLSLLLLPIPFVLAAHYGVAHRLTEERAISWRDWFDCGKEHAAFFYKWALLALVVTIITASNILFYTRLDAIWSSAVSWLLAGILLLWLIPQPFVPALYFQQSDRRLRVALRNAFILVLNDPLSTIVFWGAILVLAIMIDYIAWQLLVTLEILLALLSTRIVWLMLGRPGEVQRRA